MSPKKVLKKKKAIDPPIETPRQIQTPKPQIGQQGAPMPSPPSTQTQTPAYQIHSNAQAYQIQPPGTQQQGQTPLQTQVPQPIQQTNIQSNTSTSPVQTQATVIQQPVVQQIQPEQPVKQPHQARPKIKNTKKSTPKTPSGKIKQYRYPIRILKGSFLPFIYGIWSIIILNSYVDEFPGSFQFESLVILFGFLLGFGSMSGITLANMIKAKNNPNTGSRMSILIGLGAIIPFISIVLIIALWLNLAVAWQFSMGFFLASIFPFLIVLIYELVTKSKFIVEESLEAPSKTRRLIVVPS